MGRAIFHIALLACSVLPLTGASAWAGYCGDDVDGGRVACSCGDFVVSDTHLRADDPVVTERCPADGLIVQASHGGDGIVLDLGGLSIVGSDAGVGILVIAGGSGGAVVSGGEDERRPGQIVGFTTGMRAHGQRSVRVVSNLDFRGNRGDGLALRGHGSLSVESVGAFANGRNGLRLGGRGADVAALRATDNGQHDIDLATTAAAAKARESGYSLDLPNVHGRIRLPERSDSGAARESR